MALLDTLTGGFAQGGFSLEGTVGGLKTGLGAVQPAGASLDTDALGGVTDRLGQADLGPIGGAVGGIVGLASTIGAGFPAAGDLLQPLQSVVAAAQALTASETRNLLSTFEQAAAGAQGGVGLAGLAAPLRALEEARGGSIATTIRSVTGLVPGSAPEPPQREHVAGPETFTGTDVPRIASSNEIRTAVSRSAPRCERAERRARRPPPAKRPPNRSPMSPMSTVWYWVPPGHSAPKPVPPGPPKPP